MYIQSLYLASALGLYLALYIDTVCTCAFVLYIPGTRAPYHLARVYCALVVPSTVYTWHCSTIARGETESALGFMMEMAHICISSAAPPWPQGELRHTLSS